MIPFLYIYIIGGIVIVIWILASLYRIVPANFADVVIQSGSARVYSPHKEYSSGGKSAYFQMPSWFFILKLGMQVHRIPLNIIPVNVPNFLAFDKDRARFVCDIITYVVVKNPVEAAKRFGGDIRVLNEQISVIVQSTTRDVTTKKAIREVINNRQDIIEAISPILSATISNWGLELKSVELIDFKDPDPSTFGVDSRVIHDISSIIERQINSEARQKNAEQAKIARFKEAEADEEARKREIARDQVVAEREQEKNMKVAEQQKLAREKELEVTKVQQVKSQEIEKERAIVEANQRQEVEEIIKIQKKLEGEGDRLRAEEQAKGVAASVREQGYAEADAKERLQDALNKFGDAAIRALVAEKVVTMQQAIGVASAKALEQADIKVFVGSDGGGFDTGKIIESVNVSSESTAKSFLNKLARPMDLGFMGLGETSKEKQKEEKA